MARSTTLQLHPNLAFAEKVGYALIEQSLSMSILAAVINHTSCALTAGNYPFVDDLNITATDITTAGQSFRGTLVATTGGPGEVDDTVVDAIDGSFGVSRFGEIMVGNADGDSFRASI